MSICLNWIFSPLLFSVNIFFELFCVFISALHDCSNPLALMSDSVLAIDTMLWFSFIFSCVVYAFVYSIINEWICACSTYCVI